MPKYLLFIVCSAFGFQPVYAQTSSAGGQDDRIYTGGQRISQATTEIPVAVFSGDLSQFSIDDNQITVTATGGRSEVEDTGLQASAEVGSGDTFFGTAMGGDIRMVGDSFDDAGNLTRLDGYQLVTLRGSLPIGEHVELFGQIENLFDADYQTAAGYGSPGRGAFVGARAKF